MTDHSNPFDCGGAEATEYDAWYATPLGRSVLHAEQRCVRELIKDAEHPWLDLGTGTGRFGGDLGADLGLDPAAGMVGLAARRMPSVVLGVAEALPLRDASVGAVLSVAVLEFLDEPGVALCEVARVLRPGGCFVLGFFPQAGAWAAAYGQQGRNRESVFHGAHFFSVGEVRSVATACGLRADGARSALFEGPDRPSSDRIADGARAQAGFVALALMKPAEQGGRSR